MLDVRPFAGYKGAFTVRVHQQGNRGARCRLQGLVQPRGPGGRRDRRRAGDRPGRRGRGGGRRGGRGGRGSRRGVGGGDGRARGGGGPPGAGGRRRRRRPRRGPRRVRSHRRRARGASTARELRGGHQRERAGGGGDRGGPRPPLAGERQGQPVLCPGGVPGHATPRERVDSEPRVAGGAPVAAQPGRVHRDEGRGRRDDAQPGDRLGDVRHPRERHRADLRVDADGRADAEDPAGARRVGPQDPARADRAAARHRRRGGVPHARTRRRSSPGTCCRSTGDGPRASRASISSRAPGRELCAPARRSRPRRPG